VFVSALKNNRALVKCDDALGMDVRRGGAGGAWRTRDFEV